MMGHPLLSVIVPVYQVETWLDECVQSILNQSFTDFELILVDDGSHDGCPSICDRYAMEDSRVCVIHQPNSGVSVARNAGLDRARGKYISMIDSDDVLGPGSYEPNIAVLEAHPEVDFVQLPILERWGTESPVERRAPEAIVVKGGDEVFRSWQRNGVITGYMHNKIFRKVLFDHLRFKPGIIFEDRYLETDLFPRCRSAYVSTQGEYYYRYRSESSVHSMQEALYWRSLIISDFHLLLAMRRIGGLREQMKKKRLNILYYIRRYVRVVLHPGC